MEGKYLKARDRWQGPNTKGKCEARRGAKHGMVLGKAWYVRISLIYSNKRQGASGVEGASEVEQIRVETAGGF